MKKVIKNYELVVVGGGLSGVVAAIASARHGLKTALVQNRSVLGGNASSEVRVNINGADRNGAIKNMRETGIVLEILLENKRVNPQHSFNVLDMVMWEAVRAEENIDLYFNTNISDCVVEDGKIKSVTGVQYTSETEFTFIADLFADTTGDATLAAESGAEWTIGREARSVYNEEHAPEVADLHTMGTTILFNTKDMGYAVPFVKPDWAHTFDKEKLGGRQLLDLDFGFWWTELGGEELRVIEESENICEELYKWVYGIFDYIKNSGEYEADNLALDWIGSVPGRRESRRIIGDYVLTENDVVNEARFDDAVAYGGWTMDEHTVGGITATGADEKGTRWLPFDGIYTIPYRALYSKNVDNLFVGGRAISASHMAMSSTRVIATCGVIGQAIGTAAAIGIKEKVTCREIGNHIKDVQKLLILDDCYLPGIAIEDEKDCCQTATITASTHIAGGEPNQITNGHTRCIGETENAWISEEMNGEEWLNVAFDSAKKVSEIEVKFDPNLSDIMVTTAVIRKISIQEKTMPSVLVKDYNVEFILDGKVVNTLEVRDNYQRINKHLVDQVTCDNMKITVLNTYGDKHARIFEVKAY
ncbi:MAG: FAD-dependent oxidoreductase [Lachnospiraceae bacterium]